MVVQQRWSKTAPQLDEPATGAFADGGTVLMAQVEGKLVESSENIPVGEDDANVGIQGGQATHRRPVQVWAFKKTANGWRPRLIKSTNLRNALSDGWLTHCGDCGKQTCGVTTDANACEGRTPMKFGRCPVCAKRVFDAPAAVIEAETDPNAVDIGLAPASAEQRIKSRTELHIAVFHPQEAATYNIGVKLDQHPSVEPRSA